MAGLVKAKKYDWKDSNMALFGSDVEKQVKKSSADSEHAWKTTGTKLGLQIWRIVKFKVTLWPKEDYGKFYSGDSYIILNTYKDEEQIVFDVHFWIGQYSTQDEYGTAAYKTVELDTYLDDKPIQHREVQGHESRLFKSYFDEITILKGGAETGFRHVKPTEYKPRLMQVRGERKKISISQIPMAASRVNSDDVFILDLGLKIYQFNGQNCNKDEKFRATQYLQTVKSERGGKPKVEVLDERETDKDHEFYKTLTEEDEADEPKMEDTENELFRLSDASGSMKFNKEGAGSIEEGALDTNDVFILDAAKELYVWIGKGASEAERKNAMSYAHNYLKDCTRPFLPVSVISEGSRSSTYKAFQTALTA